MCTFCVALSTPSLQFINPELALYPTKGLKKLPDAPYTCRNYVQAFSFRFERAILRAFVFPCQVHKSSATRLKLNGDRSKGSNDRLVRVRGSWGKGSGATVTDINEPSSGCCLNMNVGDPFATLAHTKGGSVTLVLLALAKTPEDTGGDAQTLSGHRIRLVEVERSPELNAVAGGGAQSANSQEGLHLEGVDTDQPQGGGAAGSAESGEANFAECQWQWDGGRDWKDLHLVEAKLSVPLDPQLNAGLTGYSFSGEELAELLRRLELLVEATSNGRSKLLKLQGVLSDLPYHETLVSCKFSARCAGDVLVEDLRCRICNVTGIPIQPMREHGGAHILTKLVSSVKVVAVCGQVQVRFMKARHSWSQRRVVFDGYS